MRGVELGIEVPTCRKVRARRTQSETEMQRATWTVTEIEREAEWLLCNLRHLTTGCS